MATDRNTLKNWFLRGMKPLASQFAAWIDAFWHKDDTIPIESINNLGKTLNNKAENEQLQAHIKDDNNPHKLTAEKIGAASLQQLKDLEEYADSILDTFSEYQPILQKGQHNGYASLGDDGKVPVEQLPEISAGGIAEPNDANLYMRKKGAWVNPLLPFNYWEEVKGEVQGHEIIVRPVDCFEQGLRAVIFRFTSISGKMAEIEINFYQNGSILQAEDEIELDDNIYRFHCQYFMGSRELFITIEDEKFDGEFVLIADSEDFSETFLQYKNFLNAETSVNGENLSVLAVNSSKLKKMSLGGYFLVENDHLAVNAEYVFSQRTAAKKVTAFGGSFQVGGASLVQGINITPTDGGTFIFPSINPPAKDGDSFFIRINKTGSFETKVQLNFNYVMLEGTAKQSQYTFNESGTYVFRITIFKDTPCLVKLEKYV